MGGADGCFSCVMLLGKPGGGSCWCVTETNGAGEWYTNTVQVGTVKGDDWKSQVGSGSRWCRWKI